MEKKPLQQKGIVIVVNSLKYLLAIVFIFSGFVKAVDPMGTVYKIADYLEAFGFDPMVISSYILLLAMALAAFEFVIGIALLFGVNRRVTLTLYAAFLSVMTPLTLYLAIANPISDCGCFGDAFVLTNWQTFGKNVLLSLCLLFVFVKQQKVHRIMRNHTQWLVIAFAFVSVTLFMVRNLEHLPAIDFRPYKIGTSIPEAMTVPADAKQPVYETLFVLEKEGRKQTFTVENYPDSTWRFVSSSTVLKEKGFEPPIADFHIMDREDEEVTDEVLETPGYTFLLVMERLEYADAGMLDIINDIYDYCRTYGYPFYALTSSTNSMIDNWAERSGAEYDFYQVDDITLKTMVRSNPGLLLLKEGTVVNKWAARNFPRDFTLAEPLERIPQIEATRQQLYRRYAGIGLWMFFPYLFIALLDYFDRKRR